MHLEKSYLYNWVFHYNAFSSTWAAIPREDYDKYWNDINNTAILRSTNLDTLLSILAKTEGDPVLIQKLITNDSLSGSTNV